MRIRLNHKSIFPLNSWVLLLLAITFLISIPLIIILGGVFKEGGEIWSHILINLVPGYVLNTILLLLGVAALTFIIGVSTSWIVTMYRFPGRRFFEWGLILPIALPAYISGFTWAGILDYTSPVYVFARNNFGINTGQYLFFDVLSLPGAIIIFSLALYPYVYIITRAYFLSQSRVLFEVTASLGITPFQSFLRVALPMARPAVVAGISLALMEVLNDYGLVKYFGVDTFTTGIFNAWFAFGNLSAALKLSAFLMFFVFALLLLERYQRRNMRFAMSTESRPLLAKKLKGGNLWWAVGIVSIPFLFGFFLPFIMMIYWTILVFTDVLSSDFLMLLRNSFTLALMASIVITVFAIFIAYTVRTFPMRLVKLAAYFSTMGYALPGAVVAIGLLIALLWLESSIAGIIGITLLGTWFTLVFAYLVRFMAIGYNSIGSGNERVPVSLDQASRSLGVSKLKTLLRVNLPLIKTSVLAAALLVFIDVLKELPLTLILRPFNFDTLAIRTFEFASDERLAEAAPAAVIIVISGLVPVFLLNKMMRSGKP
jgi:iron(III) transport system permease protein